MKDAPAGSGWIQSPYFDLAAFLLGPLIALLGGLMMFGGFQRQLAVVWFLLLFSHYLSTATFLFWEDNRQYHRARWKRYYAAPLLVAAATVVVSHPRLIYVSATVFFVWNTYHVARQGCGILSLYRNRTGAIEERHRSIANMAILSTSFWCATANLQSHVQLTRLLAWIHPSFAITMWCTLGGLMLVSWVRLALDLHRRRARPSLPECAFLMTSLTLFHPYLWVRDSLQATQLMLLPHFIQYLAIVWLVQRRKFRTPQQLPISRALRRLASNPLLLATIATGTLTPLYLMSRHPMFSIFAFVVGQMHFYMDALLWAFKDPHVRRTMGPQLGVQVAPRSVSETRSDVQPAGT